MSVAESQAPALTGIHSAHHRHSIACHSVANESVRASEPRLVAPTEDVRVDLAA
jgi:hypothetical protein